MVVWSDGQSPRELWDLARRQHGVIGRQQLIDAGLSRRAIEHRLRKGRLHPVGHRGRTWRGVYAVGRPELTERGLLMAAVLFSGTGAVLSHETAAQLWDIRPSGSSSIDVTVPARGRHPVGPRIHRRTDLPADDRTFRQGIPVTSPTRTLIDLASCLGPRPLEAAVNEADKLDLVDPETLRGALEARSGTRGVARLRSILDRRTFVFTDSELEQRFLPLARRAGLPQPRTGVRLNGFKVDFYWPELGLVVETDGLRYHRTSTQQGRDRERDQAHAAAGLTPLRFTYAQVTSEGDRVVAILQAVADRLRSKLSD